MKSTLAALSPGHVFTDEVILVALGTYFDGATAEGRAMTLTGLAATESVWAELEPVWTQMRKDRGNPDYIHMTDLMALEGIYEGWSIDQRDCLVEGLLSALNSFMDHPQLQSFTCAVDLEAHQKWKDIKYLPSPARLCARIIFPRILDWFYKSEGIFVDSINVFFDRGEPFMHHIRADWKSENITKAYPIWNLVRVIEEVDMKLTPQIQMADMICWGFHRQATYLHSSPWEIDHVGYVTAVRAANAIRGVFTKLDGNALEKGKFLEEGQALIELWKKKGELVPNPSEEYKKFDKLMRKLVHVPHSELKAKLDEEKREKAKKRKAKKPSASGRASNGKG